MLYPSIITFEGYHIEGYHRMLLLKPTDFEGYDECHQMNEC